MKQSVFLMLRSGLPSEAGLELSLKTLDFQIFRPKLKKAQAYSTEGKAVVLCLILC